MTRLVVLALLLTGCASSPPNRPSALGVGEAPALTVTHPSAAPSRTAAPRKAARTRAVESPLSGQHLSVTCYVWTGNRTASGLWPTPGMAASNTYRFGTRLLVEGVGTVTVQDRIGHSSELDIFYASRAACLRFGRQRLHVTVLR